MPSVYVKTLGCKVNTYDSHALENQFQAQGYSLVEAPDAADVTVINSCSVTSNAEKEARYLARRFRRLNPATYVVMTGCYAQVDSANLAALAELDLVVPNEAKERLVGLVQAGLERRHTPLEPAAKLPADVPAVRNNRQSHFKASLTLFDKASSSRTRAFLKVQDGCNGFCTYCIIPYARGASRSVQSADVIAEVTRLCEAGTREIVLTGIHIGDYGHDLGAGESLVSLLERLIKIPGVERLRISSLEPTEFTTELASLMAAHPRVFCDHFHMPLQSGSDRILKLMRRTYDTGAYAEKVALARRVFPNANIGADVICGFPGETAADFQATLAFIKSCDFSYLHVFPYSKRPNTAAFRMQEHLAPELIKERAAALRALGQQQQDAYARRFLGQTVEALWENDHDSQGRPIGHTRNYLNVVAPTGTSVIPGTQSLIKLKGFVEDQRLLGLPV